MESSLSKLERRTRGGLTALSHHLFTVVGEYGVFIVVAKFIPGLSTIGAMLWVGSALVAGMLCSSQIESALLRLDDIGSVVGVVLAAALAAYDIANRIKDLPWNRDVVRDCASPSEASTARVAKLLLQGGLDAWAAAGYAVVGVSKPQ